MTKVMISTTIEESTYARIKKERLRINELIESAIHYKDMDVRQVSELLGRIEKMSQLLEKTNKRVWELEGRFIEEIKGKGD